MMQVSSFTLQTHCKCAGYRNHTAIKIFSLVL